MFVLENLKKTLGKVTGVGKPSASSARRAVRRSKPHALMFKDDGSIPNNSRLPFLLYRGAVGLTGSADPAGLLGELFQANDWGDSWRNGIYEYVHYHSRTHEVLGIARGHARVRFGGNEGKIIALRSGDVVILPAGTGHQRISASKQLLVVGAYPPSGTYDECMPLPEHRERALKSIPKVPTPVKDPVYGKGVGRHSPWSIPQAWRGRRSADQRAYDRRTRCSQRGLPATPQGSRSARSW